MRHIVRSGLALAVCAVAVTWVLAGCGPASTAARPEAPAGPAEPTVLDLLTHAGSYRPDEQIVRAAEDLLVSRCMAAAGQRYPATPPPADRRTDDERELDLAGRVRDGYGLGGVATTDGPALDRYVRSLPAARRSAYMLALFGPEDRRRAIELPVSGEVSFPSSGCLHDAQRRIYGDIVSWARITYLPEDLNNVLTERVTAGPGYAAVLREWSACMSRRGHRYPTPAAARADLAERYRTSSAGPGLRKFEIAVAVADGECARQVRIPARVRELKAAAVGTLPADQRRALDECGWAWRRAVTVASRIRAAG
jgi:hypothetical protein